MNSTEATHPVVLAAVIVGWLAFWILAVVSIMGRPAVGGVERGVWVVFVITFPFVGPLAWSAWGQTRQRSNLS